MLLMLSSFRVGAAVFDRDGRAVMADDPYLEILGWRRDRLHAITREAITHPEDRGRDLLLVDQQKRDSRPFEITARYLRPDGATVWVQNRVSPLPGDGDGKVLVLSRPMPEENGEAGEGSATDRLTFAGLISETAYALGVQAHRFRLQGTAALLQKAADSAIPEAQN